jgi:5-methylcytosine-specific restriction endonuclease McrA
MSDKKLIRKRFRYSCFSRDNYCCVMCGFKSSKEKSEDELDAHHIISRKEMPNGGYVKENGISLCGECHIKAEKFYSDGVAELGFSIDDLFNKIKSNKELAIKFSLKLK